MEVAKQPVGQAVDFEKVNDAGTHVDSGDGDIETSPRSSSASFSTAPSISCSLSQPSPAFPPPPLLLVLLLSPLFHFFLLLIHRLLLYPLFVLHHLI